MYRYTDNYCVKCHLQEDPFHGIAIDDRGLCSLCVKESAPPRRDWDALRESFESRLQKVRGHLPYEGVVMMSGGKDSACMAHLLKERYGLNLLAFVIDNGFEYPETFDNAADIVRKLDMPYVLYRQDPVLMRRYYRFLFREKNISQRDCGQVCTFCGRFLIRTAADFACSMNIPLVFSGHNPDQIFLMGESIETDPGRLTLMEFIVETTAEDVRKATEAWLGRRHPQVRRFFPEALSPAGVTLLFPFQHFPYRPEAMKRVVQEQLGWVPIRRFSKTYIASGCRLVKLWAYLARCAGTNNYVDFEFSAQVRNGVLAPETLRRFYDEAEVEHDELLALVRELDMVDDMRDLLRELSTEDAFRERLDEMEESCGQECRRTKP